MSVSDLIEEARRFLSHFPEIEWKLDSSVLTIPPVAQTGFAIGLEDGAGATIWCHMWHEHFTDKEECLKLFKGLLARRSRVVAVKRGNTEHFWTLEVETDGDWQSLGSVGTFAFPFWKPRTEVVYENPPRVPP